MAVEIIGRACKSAGAASPEELFRLLRDGRCAVTEIPDERWDKARYWHPEVGVPGKTYTFAAGVIPDVMDFDPVVFGISPREAESFDPQQRLILRMAWRAMEDANLTAGLLQHERVGVYVGASSLEHGNLIAGDPAAASPYFMTGNTLSLIANRISHVLGLHGPSLTVDTACSSGLVALDLAVRALEAGDIDTAIVGSVNVLAHPLSFVGFAQARMLSPTGQCRAYDNRAEGYVRAEGGAVFILRSSDRASAAGDRSHARIIASAVNSAGHTNGISLPSREAQAALLHSIYQGRGIDVSHLAFVEGHGTGTRVGDPAEIWALGTEIGQRRRAPIPVGSIKSNIGHTEPASGLLGLMKAMLALEHNCLPPSLHFETPSDQIDFAGLNVSVVTDAIQLLPSKRPRLAGVNSFGFGGTNAHVVISDPERAPAARRKQHSELLLVTAQSATSLKELLTAYSGRIARTPKPNLPDLVAAIGANRPHMRHRFVLHARDPKTLAHEVDGFVTGAGDLASEVGEAARDQAKTAFVFSGNGSQWAGMALDAYRVTPAFRDRFNVVDALFRGACDINLKDLLADPDLDVKLADTQIAQPLLFATQAALADTLLELGLMPSACYGHSIGEIAAAYVTGALSLVDAVTIVARRSHHQRRMAGMGKMAAVAMGSDEAIRLARSAGLDRICVAASNAHNAATVSGPADEIVKFKEAATSMRIAAQVLDINYPFHHPLIDAARANFLRDMSSLAPRPTRIPFISTVTGDVLDGESLDRAYWWRNLREQVLFDAATGAAIREGCRVFVEIGPRPILTSYLRDTIRQHNVGGAVAPTFARHGHAPHDCPVRRAFAKAVAIGGAFDVEKAIGVRNAEADLPSLPFEMTGPGYAKTLEALDIFGDGRRNTHTLVGWRIDATSSAWHNHIDAHLYPDLAEHVVDGRPILPGSAFIDMVLAVARRHHGDSPFEITNLEILHPMELSRSRLLEVSTVVSVETGRIEIRSRERLKEADWTLNAVARIRATAVAVAWNAADVSATSKVIEVADVYRTAENFGLAYGPAFRLLEQVSQRGDWHIDVALAPAAKPAHPYLTYELNPMSTDAALHGLVGLFGQFAADADTVPYIPVHFGVIQLHQPAAAIRGAAIAVERISLHAIKAHVRLLDADGAAVATLIDCRLRRSRLRLHKSLEAQSFHYEAVASHFGNVAGDPPGDNLTPVLRPVLPQPRLQPLRSTTDAPLILDAAVYRACWDVVLRRSGGRRRLVEPVFTGDPAFDSFLGACLLWLEETGLATAADDGWQLVEQCSLPPFADLLLQFLREDAGRSVEAVLLIDAYHMALDRAAGTAIAPAHDDSSRPRQMSEITLEHARSHSPAIEFRQSMVIEALERTVQAAVGAGRVSPHVVELCAVSKALSLRLAQIAAAAHARLTIVESDARLRKELELVFQDVAHVEVSASVDAGLSADIVISVSDDLYGILELDGPERSLVNATLGAGGVFVACVDTPNPFSDFVFGQCEGWYARTANPAFPIGKLATIEDWQRLAGHLGAREARNLIVDTPVRKALALAWSGRPEAPMQVPRKRSPAVVFGDAGLVSGAGTEARDGRPFWVALTGRESEDQPDVVAALAGLPADGAVVYFAGSFGETQESDALQANVSALAVLVRQISTRAGGSETGCPRLAVLLEGGAPLSRPEASQDLAHGARNAGLWSFLRVVRNEYPDVDIHALDLSGSGKSMSDQLALAAMLCETPTLNREWLWDDHAGGLCEVRVVPGPAPRAELTTRDFSAGTVRQTAVTGISTLAWETAEPGPLLSDEVRIEVTATALNYRDVMWAIGLLPVEALEDGFAGPSIGMECSGRVVAVGGAVQDLAVGDPVMAVAPNAFSTHVTTSAICVAKLPEMVPLVAGATLPVAFLTAYYALVELAGLREGETVLIHGGAGGVGLAALQIARVRGAQVIATASTIEKRRLLTMLGADHVLDSRSLDFAGQIMELTGQEGVDVVLNSLFGDAMERSISTLKPFGRFLELGKRDYYSDTKIGLRPFRRNISYFGIDADQLIKSRPDLTARMFAGIAELFGEGQLYPLPYRAFGHDELLDAFRLMQGSGHIGKIVVTPPVSGKDAVARAPAPTSALCADGIYLVVGGTGGFGLATADWLVDRGARKIALMSRHGVLDEAGAATLARWASLGVRASVHACDVTDEAALSALLDELRARAPLRGVVHAAMVLDDALLANLDRDRNRPVIETKAKGAELLDRLTRADELDEFILFSSVTTLIGNPGQANYVAGNGFLEGLARARRKSGLPAIAVGFAAISDVGYLASGEAATSGLAKRLGKFSLTSRGALEKLREFIVADPGTVDAASVVLADLNLDAIQSFAIAASPLFSVLARALKYQPPGLTGDGLDLVALVEGKSAKEGEQLIFDLVAREIAATLRMPAAEIARTRAVREIGIDSLMAMELGMNFQQKTGFDLPLSSLSDGTTVGDISYKLYLRVSGTAEIAAPHSDTAILEQLAARHMEGAEPMAVKQ